MADPVVILEVPSVTVEPGKTAKLPYRVKNLGRRIMAYDIEVRGEPAVWARPEKAEITARARGGETTSHIVFSPPAGSAVESGEVPFVIVVTSKVDDGRGTAEGVVIVDAALDLAMAVKPQAEGRWGATFPVTIKNTGNEPVRIAILADDPAEKVDLTVAEAVHTVEVGEEITTKIKAKARNPRLRGTQQVHPFTVETRNHPFGAVLPLPGEIVQPADDRLRHVRPVSFTQKPILTRGVGLLIALLPLLLVALIALRLFGGSDQDPGLATPVPPGRVAVEPGSTVLLVSWLPASGSIGFEVQVGDERPVPVEGSGIGTLSVEGLDPDTEYRVKVRSIGPEGAGNSAFGPDTVARTTPPPLLTVPSALAFDGTTLTWAHDPGDFEPASVEFTVFVDGKAEGTVAAGVMMLALPDLEPGSHVLTVQARAEDAESDFAPSLSVEVVGAPAGGGGNGDGPPPTDPTTGQPVPTDPDGSPTESDDLGLVALVQFVVNDAAGREASARQQAERVGRRVTGATVDFFTKSRFDTVLVDEQGRPLEVNGDGQVDGWWVYADLGPDDDAPALWEFCRQILEEDLVETCRPAQVTAAVIAYLGLDVGTTYCAAVVGDDERLQVVPLDSHETVVPSAVHITADGDESFAGTALRRGRTDPAGLSVGFKRSFGDKVPQVLSGHRVTSHELTERLLGWIGEQIVQFTGRLPTRAVITHPAHWERIERDLLIRAATSALDTQVTLLTEPEAIAIHYARERDVHEATLAVYDFGGGTFDATVVKVDTEGHHILGTPVGRRDIGGIDLDDLVRMWSIEQIGRDRFAELDRSTPEVQLALRRLSVAASEAKETLSSEAQAVLPVDLPGLQQNLRLTRGEFEEMARPLVVETVEALKTALSGADVDPSELSATILAGGSSRVPLVSEVLAERLGVRTVADVHPKLAVAMGAAASLQQRALPPPVADDGDAVDEETGGPGDTGGDDGGRESAGREHADRTRPPVVVDTDDERTGLPSWSLPAIAIVLVLIVGVLVVPGLLGGDDASGDTETATGDGSSTTDAPSSSAVSPTLEAPSDSAAFLNTVEAAMGDQRDSSSLYRFIFEVVRFPDENWSSVKDCQDHRANLTDPLNFGSDFGIPLQGASQLPDPADFPDLAAPDLGALAATLLTGTLEDLSRCEARVVTPTDTITNLVSSWADLVAGLCSVGADTNYLAPATSGAAPSERCPEGSLPELSGLVVAQVFPGFQITP